MPGLSFFPLERLWPRFDIAMYDSYEENNSISFIQKIRAITQKDQDRFFLNRSSSSDVLDMEKGLCRTILLQFGKIIRHKEISTSAVG